MSTRSEAAEGPLSPLLYTGFAWLLSSADAISSAAIAAAGGCTAAAAAAAAAPAMSPTAAAPVTRSAGVPLLAGLSRSAVPIPLQNPGDLLLLPPPPPPAVVSGSRTHTALTASLSLNPAAAACGGCGGLLGFWVRGVSSIDVSRAFAWALLTRPVAAGLGLMALLLLLLAVPAAAAVVPGRAGDSALNVMRGSALLLLPNMLCLGDDAQLWASAPVYVSTCCYGSSSSLGLMLLLLLL